MIKIDVGNPLFVKHLGSVNIISVDENTIVVFSDKRGNLEFTYNDIGKTLYYEKSHTDFKFNTNDEYMDFCNKQKKEENKRKKLIKQNELKANREIIEKTNQEKIKLEQENLRKQRFLEDEIDQKKLFLDYLYKEYQFEGFHHYTDFKNFISIMNVGKLFSRNKIARIGFYDSAEKDIINKTDNEIRDFVRFYYKENTPTTYNNEGIKLTNESPHMPIPVLILFDEEIIYHDNIEFTSGNAGSNNSFRTNYVNVAKKHNWSNIFDRSPILRNEEYEDEYDYQRNKTTIINNRNAEFLYPEEISIRYVKKIIYRSLADHKRAIYYFGENPKFLVNKYKFNNKHNYLTDYNIKKYSTYILIELFFYKNPKKYSHELKVEYSDGANELINIYSEDYRIKNIIDNYDNEKIVLNFITINCKEIHKMEYLMNGHVSAIWGVSNSD